MHEVSWRQALTMSVFAAVEGVVALVLGAFVAPIAPHAEAVQIATAVFIRGFLALIALAVAGGLAYFAGYRIEASLGPSDADPSLAVATSPLVALFVTPGPRRDAFWAGAITLATYWLFTTIYIAALGNTVGGIGVPRNAIGSFALSRLAQGVALAVAGAGVGALGARNAATRRITRRIFEPAPVVVAAPLAPLAPPQPIQPIQPIHATQPSEPPQPTAREAQDASARADVD